MKHDGSCVTGMSDQEKELASSAYECFLAGRYEESMKHLEALLEFNKEDYKIAMNKAVTEFYRSSQTTTGTLRPEFAAMIEAAKYKLHQYKVRAYIQMKSSKACKREIKSVMNTAGNSAPSLFLKSNFEYLRGNYRKAVKLLNSCNIADITCMFVRGFTSQHNLGIFYFKKALQENDHTCAQLGDGSSSQAKSFTGMPMCALLANKRYELLYNCGIQLLHIGRPLAAFECLMEAVQVYHSNPRLWLRLAECCISANKGGSEQESKGLPCKKGIVQSVIGQGYHRKIVLASQSAQNTAYSEGQSAAIPVASMEFAAICLRNALLLLPEQHQQDAMTESSSRSSSQSGGAESSCENSDTCSIKGQETDKFMSATPSSPLRKQEVENLRCSILACSAYVALALGDNLMALNHAEKLLNQNKLSGSLKFLGHIYAAEALISLDRISDAISHLNPENVSDVSVGVVSSDPDQGPERGEEPVEPSGKKTPLCYPGSVAAARSIMLFNLGSAYCLRSEYDKARNCLNQAVSITNGKEIPPEAILLGVYLELQNGNTQLALQIIKRNQLLPMAVHRTSPESHRKATSTLQSFQPLQLPSSFTQVQRK
uniref:CCR4-NOT transcription complex subunit 10 n=1 Tax=Oryzias latipes TaxID=8090 RepID=A0A3P9LKD1_ORYLA